ncbi:hypothetical protein BEP19_16525 [Ammoniphilus oxalaticus]|uniref:Calcineurin-like phosphoesterase domain-containing protein n=1 Tax=Ammoniphilus oxalaticus TaxID=66863 RepID=A0A419SQT4_9BACL|nr:DNA repair exonuclease [Ammoniphilus oxalaticus]RKD26801.1 hypothetical protein BEP19_16525 [Ammoniphilus oxalaticus]
MGFSFVHAADLHLDTPFVGLSHLPQMIREQIQQSTFAALDQLVQLCLEENVDFLIIAGDVYDCKERSLAAQLRFQQAMCQLAERGIRVFVAHGNHDPLDGYRAQLNLPPAIHVFSGEQVEAIPVWRNGKEIARVYGMSYATSRVTERLVRRFRRETAVPYALGVLHTNVGGDPSHDNYAPCSLEELAQTGMDYWALGHIHRRQVLRERQPTIAYAGNTQGRHSRESGEKGCLLGRVNHAGETTLTFRPLDVIRWVEHTVDAEANSTEQSLIDLLDDEIGGLKASNGNRSLIIRLRLRVGQTLADQLGRHAFLQDILDRYRVEQTPFLWLQQIDWEQQLVEEEDPFVVELLNQWSELSGDAALREAWLQEAVAPLLNEHRLGSKWLANLRDEPIDWEREVERLIRGNK